MQIVTRTVRPKSVLHQGLVDDMATKREGPTVAAAARASKRELDDAAPVQDDCPKRQRGVAEVGEASHEAEPTQDVSAKDTPEDKPCTDASKKETPEDKLSRDASETPHAAPSTEVLHKKGDDKPSTTSQTACSEQSKTKGSALGFGAFASRSAPFQSATAFTEKADAASDNVEKDWATDKAAAPIQREGDNVVRMKEVPKPDVELTTGEEEEDTVASARAKLYSLAENQVWKERGTGAIKINVHKPSASARLVMRLDAVFKLILNVKLFPGMQCHLDQERFLRVVAMEPDGLTHFLLKFGNAAEAHAFLTRLQEHIPASS